MTSRTLSPLLVLVMHVVALPDVARAGEGHRDEPTVSIRIYDYAGVPQRPLSRAQVVVSSMFETIGVRTEWLDAVRPSEWTQFRQRPAITEIGHLTLIVLTPNMVSRKKVPDAAVGYAAVAPGEVGRVAYVIYDRVQDLARMSAARDWQLMGMVMAHEIGHLLMPAESHSRDGLMREVWNRTELRRFAPGDFTFSTSQATQIRRTLADGVPYAP